MPLLRHLSVRNASHQLLLYFWPYCIVFFSCILPFSSIFSYISKNSSLQSFSSHEFLFFGFSNDYILLNFSENSTKNIDNNLQVQHTLQTITFQFGYQLIPDFQKSGQVLLVGFVLFHLCYWVTTCLEIMMQV